MTPPTFRIGDLVEITGPTIVGCKLHAGEKFTITQAIGVGYTGNGFSWYPASSLRLVDELKIGDYAEVIRPGISETGKIIKIIRIDETEYPIQAEDRCWYRRSSLRKLTPDEIKQHMNPGKPTYEYPTTPSKDFDELSLKDVARMAGICKNEYGVWISTLLERAHKSDERLSIIEHRESAICKYNIETEKRLQKLESIQVPDEMRPIKVIPTAEGNAKRLDAHREEIDDVNERLSAIEQRQGAQQNRMDEIDDRCSEVIDANDGILSAWKAEREDIKKRLDFLEAFQKDKAETQSDDMIDITILRRADRTLHVWHSRDPDECLDWAKRVMDEMGRSA